MGKTARGARRRRVDVPGTPHGVAGGAGLPQRYRLDLPHANGDVDRLAHAPQGRSLSSCALPTSRAQVWQPPPPGRKVELVDPVRLVHVEVEVMPAHPPGRAPRSSRGHSARVRGRSRAGPRRGTAPRRASAREGEPVHRLRRRPYAGPVGLCRCTRLVAGIKLPITPPSAITPPPSFSRQTPGAPRATFDRASPRSITTCAASPDGEARPPVAVGRAARVARCQLVPLPAMRHRPRRDLSRHPDQRPRHGSPP